MKFPIKKKVNSFENKYPKMNRDIARKFISVLYKEMGDFISAAVLFGSVSKNKSRKSSDIDILIVLDDVHIDITKEIVETYRIILQKIVSRHNPDRLHVQTLRLTDFWEYTRSGDPVAINILRDGIALIDKGFFDPLQLLLLNGRIRPSKESIMTYVNMSNAALLRSKLSVDNAIVDLYWACIDISHSVLMNKGEIPVSPGEITDMMNKKLVKTGELEKSYLDIMDHMYQLSKKILKREVTNLTGKDYDKYLSYTNKYIARLKKLI